MDGQTEVLLMIVDRLDKVISKLDEVNENLWKITGENTERYGTSLKEISEQITETSTTMMEHLNAVADSIKG